MTEFNLGDAARRVFGLRILPVPVIVKPATATKSPVPSRNTTTDATRMLKEVIIECRDFYDYG